jgi:hypothetical protein
MAAVPYRKGTAVFALLAVLFWPMAAMAFEPVSYESPNARIVLSRLSTYRVSGFADSAVDGPLPYDADRHRLYFPVPSKQRIDVIDISDPTAPEKVRSIELGQFGNVMNGVAYNGKVLAIAFSAGKNAPGVVVLLDRTGDLRSPPIQVGFQPTSIVFTPDRRTMVVPCAGEATADYSDDPDGTVALIDTCDFDACRDQTVKILDFSRFNKRKSALIKAGVRIYGPGASVAEDIEPAAVAIAPDSHTAWVTVQRNNAIAKVNLRTRTIVRISPVGFKDNSLEGQGLDASDVDGAINIRPWPLHSFYHPDKIFALKRGAEIFLVTANEGDPRDFSDYSEVTTVAGLDLDPSAFPTAALLKQRQNLGRLEVSAIDGDTDGDGDHDAIYAYGGRSFAVWTTSGRLLFDSGDSFERVLSEAVPAYFNVSDTDNNFDSRSRTRGAEPEPLDVGVIDGRTYAFIGFERTGGVMAYDITDPRDGSPASDRFQQYINYRNFAVDPADCIDVNDPPAACRSTGDLSVEGVTFIPRSQSPIDRPLLVLSHETTPSVTIYGIGRKGE